MTGISLGEVRHIEPAFVDARGSITDILTGETIDGVTIITTHGGAVRGNHYHAETVQWLYILHGRMRITMEVPGAGRRSVILDQGDLLGQAPGERHAMRALEETTFVVLTRGPRGGRDYESDTFRLPESDWLERPEVT